MDARAYDMVYLDAQLLSRDKKALQRERKKLTAP